MMWHPVVFYKFTDCLKKRTVFSFKEVDLKMEAAGTSKFSQTMWRHTTVAYFSVRHKHKRRTRKKRNHKIKKNVVTNMLPAEQTVRNNSHYRKLIYGLLIETERERERKRENHLSQHNLYFLNIHGSVHRNNILVYKSQQDVHVTDFIWQLLYMFRASLSPIFRSAKQM